MSGPPASHWCPHVHFTAARNWISDPNGLVWHDGEYHLFYQHNPNGVEWGHMSWGHAVSSDLLHWHELPLAIAEDDDWMIFSGSVVVDHANTSGLARGGKAPMVALYTGASRGSSGIQNQQLAFSLDRGRTWTKYASNPVLDLGERDFRDPLVFWHEATTRWIMLVSMATRGHLRFFASQDLLEWHPLSECHIELPGSCRIWECPSLMRLPVHGRSESQHAWLLKFDVFEGHPGGGSGALAVVGDFDGIRFVQKQPVQWVDGGRDFYAAMAFGAMPPDDGRCVWLAWMNDHRYAKATPTGPWRGAMTLPRELHLAEAGGVLRLAQQPARELASLRSAPLQIAPCTFDALGITLAERGQLPAAHDVEIEVAFEGADGFALALAVGGDQATRVGVDRTRGELFIDSTHGGIDIGFGFAGRRSIAWHGARGERVRLRIVVDACSVEVFGGDGLAVLTELIFPPAGATGMRIASRGASARLLSWRAWPLRRAAQL